MMTELEHLDDLDKRLQNIFDAAVDARNHAQEALERTNHLKQLLTQRRIELLRAETTAARSE